MNFFNLFEAITEEEFETTILADPENITAWLTYADWLEESGDVIKAEYIRIAMELAHNLYNTKFMELVTRAGNLEHRIIYNKVFNICRNLITNIWSLRYSSIEFAPGFYHFKNNMEFLKMYYIFKNSLTKEQGRLLLSYMPKAFRATKQFVKTKLEDMFHQQGYLAEEENILKFLIKELDKSIFKKKTT